MCGLKKLASWVFSESWKVLAERRRRRRWRRRRRRKRTKNNKSPGYPGWLNNREAGDLTRHHVHFDVIVMTRDLYLKDISINWQKCYKILTKIFTKRASVNGVDWCHGRNWCQGICNHIIDLFGNRKVNGRGGITYIMYRVCHHRSLY